MAASDTKLDHIRMQLHRALPINPNVT